MPEGAAVTVRYPATAEAKPPVQKKRIAVPLVRTNEPGSVPLTGKQIGEILDEEGRELLEITHLNADDQLRRCARGKIPQLGPIGNGSVHKLTEVVRWNA